MDYSQEHILLALQRATDTINSRGGETKYGYNCCWSFVVEYDKELRGKKAIVDLSYANPQEFVEAVKAAGFPTFLALANHYNYKSVRNKRPKVGDVAYTRMDDGSISALIVGKSRWLTSTGATGVKHLHQWSFLERHIPLITRPQRS
jgi:hypothetical protein